MRWQKYCSDDIAATLERFGALLRTPMGLSVMRQSVCAHIVTTITSADMSVWGDDPLGRRQGAEDCGVYRRGRGLAGSDEDASNDRAGQRNVGGARHRTERAFEVLIEQSQSRNVRGRGAIVAEVVGALAGRNPGRDRLRGTGGARGGLVRINVG